MVCIVPLYVDITSAIVFCQPYAVCAVQAVQSTGNKVISWAEALQMGAAKIVPADPPKPDDLSTIMYTSGTTGGFLLRLGNSIYQRGCLQFQAHWGPLQGTVGVLNCQLFLSDTGWLYTGTGCCSVAQATPRV